MEVKNDAPTSFQVQDMRRNLDDKWESHLQISQISCATICNVLLELAIKDIAPFKSVTKFNDAQQWLYYDNAWQYLRVN